MRNRTRTRWSRLLGLIAVVCALMVAGAAAAAPEGAGPGGVPDPRSAPAPQLASVPFATGDVLLGIGGGQINHFSNTGTLKNTLQSPNSSTEDTGMAFDAGGNLYATEFEANNITKYDTSGNVLGNFGSGFQNPESIVRDAAGNFYVGQVGGSQDVLKVGPTGTTLGNFDVATDRGSDWIDLASDQCTLYYTSESTSVKRFDVCTNTQLPDFATGLPGGAAFALRIMPSSGEVLVADQSSVVRLDTSGQVVKTYTAPGLTFSFAANLDPDGTSFWTADFNTGEIFRFDIATGNVIKQFTSNVNQSAAGLAVVGELTAGVRTLTVNLAGTGTGSVSSNPTGITCPTDCTEDYTNGASVTLTATPATGSTFSGWSGACTGTGTCTVTMNDNKDVTATFSGGGGNPTLTVMLAGTGSGSVSSSPAGITCPSTCSASYPAGTMVGLTATPVAGSTFTGWSGACTGTGACNVTMDADKSVTATFTGTTPPPGLGEVEGEGHIGVNFPAKFDMEDVQRTTTGRLEGRFEFSSRSRHLSFESTAILTFDRLHNVAHFTGMGELNDRSGYTYTVTAVDNGHDRTRPDRFSLEIRNSANVVVYSSNGLRHVQDGGILIEARPDH